MKTLTPREAYSAGLSLIELMGALTILAVVVSSLGFSILAVSQGQRLGAERFQLLSRAERLIEEIKGVSSSAVVTVYDGMEVAVPGITGNFASGALQVAADDTDPNLLVVTVTANWTTRGEPQTFVLPTKIFNPNG